MCQFPLSAFIPTTHQNAHYILYLAQLHFMYILIITTILYFLFCPSPKGNQKILKTDLAFSMISPQPRRLGGL